MSFHSGWMGKLRVATCGALLVLGAGQASAMTVVYSWTPDPGQGGSGTLTIDSPSIVDPANFAGVAAGALIGLTYTWNNGATINLASVVTNNAPSWTACAGTLITGFQITANSVPATAGTFSLANSAGSCFPGPTVLAGPGYDATNSVHLRGRGQRRPLDVLVGHRRARPGRRLADALGRRRPRRPAAPAPRGLSPGRGLRPGGLP